MGFESGDEGYEESECINGGDVGDDGEKLTNKGSEFSAKQVGILVDAMKKGSFFFEQIVDLLCGRGVIGYTVRAELIRNKQECGNNNRFSILVDAMRVSDYSFRQIVDLLCGRGIIDYTVHAMLIKNEQERVKKNLFEQATDALGKNSAELVDYFGTYTEEGFAADSAKYVLGILEQLENVYSSDVRGGANGFDLIREDTDADIFVLQKFETGCDAKIEFCLAAGEKGESFLYMRPEGELNATRIMKFYDFINECARQES
ncbi:hypothetical protein KKG71_06295 [Patescibacteria group bacterium]|nr:hypothetical protein [Patescibacteria group bacterium]